MPKQIDGHLPSPYYLSINAKGISGKNGTSVGQGFMLIQSMYTFPLGMVAMGLLFLIFYLICSSCSRERPEDIGVLDKERRTYIASREKTWTSEMERPAPPTRKPEMTPFPSPSEAAVEPSGDFKPERMDPVLFEKLLDDMTSSAFTFEMEGLTTPELRDKIDRILRDYGFTIVRNIIEDENDERIEVKIGGWTRQISTDK
ncbi:MAG: hypothetical protein ACFFER_07270, partial [Candidatus Thorarchaeota archaeon]